jgi:hypothetical protein
LEVHVKALEFEAKLGADANLRVPDDIASQIPTESPLRVIVLLPESSEDADWQRLTREQFLRGYCDADDIYDAL